MAEQEQEFGFNDLSDPASGINEDFSLSDEYKPPPLVPQGNYIANVLNVLVDSKRSCIAWQICLDGNGGMQSDGVTPIDGKHLWFRCCWWWQCRH